MRAADLARYTGILAAACWLFGLLLAAGASAILPTDASYFWLGVAEATVGALLIPIARTTPRDVALQVIGLAVASAMAIAGTALALGAAGLLGDRAPSWLLSSAGAPLLALFVWIAATSYRGRHPQDLGSAACAFGGLNAVAVPIGILGWIDPYTHTNATAGIDALMAMVVLAAVPGWTIAVSLHFWREARLPAQG